MKRSLALLSLALLAPDAFAQSFNIDVGDNTTHALPSNAYGAAAAQPGHWMSAPTLTLSSVPLVDITGASTGASLSWTGGNGDFSADNATWSGDDDKLMEDAADIGSSAMGFGTMTWSLTGLSAGDYEIYTYADAPDFPATYRTRVTITGAVGGAQIVGGAWNGSPHALTVTYARHTITVTGPSQIVSIVTDDPHTVPNNYPCVNGFQVKKLGGSGVDGPFCFGDGSGTACPCGNASAPAAQAGCLNSLGSGGKLVANGSAHLSLDTLTLSGSAMPSSSALYFQGTTRAANGAGAVFGDGLRCAGGSIVRLRSTVNSVAGSSQVPSGADPSISTLGVVTSPGVRTYQVWYRNAASFCQPETFNLTNGVQVTWQP